MTRVAITRDRDEERAVRFDQILEELRLNTEDMRELAKRAVERARETSRNLKATVEKARAERAVRKVGKKKTAGHSPTQHRDTSGSTTATISTRGGLGRQGRFR